MKMNHSQAQKNKPKTNPIKACPALAEALSAAEWANFSKGQNRLPENPATPPSYTLRQLFDIIVLYEYHSQITNPFYCFIG